MNSLSNEWKDLCYVWYGPRAQPGGSNRATSYFRHWLELTDPQEGWLQVNTRRGYILYVNGQLVDRNINIHAWWQHEIGEFLRPGRNLIAIQAQAIRNVPDGLLAFGKIVEGDGRVVQVLTNGSWEAATSVEEGWEQPDVQHSEWDRAVPLDEMLEPGIPGTLEDPSPVGYSLADSRKAIAWFDTDIFEDYVTRFLPGRRPVEGERMVVSRFAMQPNLIRLANGELLALLRRGACHSGINGRIDLVRSTDDGRTWSEPQTVVDGKWDHRDGAFGQMPDGSLVVIYNLKKFYWPDGTHKGSAPPPSDPPPVLRERGHDLRLTCSHDNGHTWEPPRELDIPASAYPGLIQVLQDGSAVVPLRYFPPETGRKCAALARSWDNGVTWGEVVVIADRHSEPPILELPDGRLICFARRTSQQQGICGDGVDICWSFDRGYHWTEPRPFLGPQEVPVSPLLLRDGRILVTYGYRKFPFGVRGVISRDYGRTWDWDNELIIAWESCSPDCGYPRTVQLPSGEILTIYYSAVSKLQPELGLHVAGVIYSV